MARERDYNTQNARSGYTPLGVGYYSVYDPQWNQLMARGLDESQKRYDEAVTTIETNKSQLLELPVDPMSQRSLVNYVTETTKEIEDYVNNKYNGDYGAALNDIKSKVIEARNNLVPAAKQAMEAYNTTKNYYLNLQAQGRNPVRFYKDEKGNIQSEQVPFEEFYNEPLLSIKRDPELGTSIIAFNPYMPEISTRGDYSRPIDKAVEALRSKFYRKEERTYDDNGVLSGTSTTETRGFNASSFDQFLQTNEGEKWLKESLEELLTMEPAASKEFVSKDNKKDFDYDTLKQFFTEAVRTKLFGSYSKTIDVKTPRKNGETNKPDPLDMLPSVTETETTSKEAVVPSLGDRSTSSNGIFQSISRISSPNFDLKINADNIDSNNVIKANVIFRISKNGDIYEDYVVPTTYTGNRFSGPVSKRITGVNFAQLLKPAIEMGILEIGIEDIQNKQLAHFHYVFFSKESLNDPNKLSMVKDALNKDLAYIRVLDPDRLKVLARQMANRYPAYTMKGYSATASEDNKRIAQSFMSSGSITPVDSGKKFDPGDVTGVIFSPNFKDQVILTDGQSEFKYYINDPRMQTLHEQGYNIYRLKTDPTLDSYKGILELNQPIPIKINGDTVHIVAVGVGESDPNSFENKLITIDSNGNGHILSPKEADMLIENNYRLMIALAGIQSKSQY